MRCVCSSGRVNSPALCFYWLNPWVNALRSGFPNSQFCFVFLSVTHSVISHSPFIALLLFLFLFSICLAQFNLSSICVVLFASSVKNQSPVSLSFSPLILFFPPLFPSFPLFSSYSFPFLSHSHFVCKFGNSFHKNIIFVFFIRSIQYYIIVWCVE